MTNPQTGVKEKFGIIDKVLKSFQGESARTTTPPKLSAKDINGGEVSDCIVGQLA